MFKKIKEWLYLRSVIKQDEDEDLFVWNSRGSIKDRKIDLGYRRFVAKQIIEILKIIDGEIVRSYRLGLKLSREHVIKEKAASLGILHEMGHLLWIIDNVKPEDAHERFSGLINELMKLYNLLVYINPKELKKKGMKGIFVIII